MDRADAAKLVKHYPQDGSGRQTSRTTGSLPKLEGRVLVAEDNPINLEIVSRVLSKVGLAVVGAKNGDEAVQRVEQESSGDTPFDVVLMDMQMPVLDGCEATRRLRAKGHNLPIIALTANALKSDRDKCYAAGCNGFCTKPINSRQLVEAIAGMLDD